MVGRKNNVGRSISRCKSLGNNGWVDQKGTIMKTEHSSIEIFLKVGKTKEKGGNAYTCLDTHDTKNASMVID